MKTRIITALIFAAIGVPILFLSEYIVFPIALALFSLLATVELLRVFGVHKSYLIAEPSFIIAVVLPFLSYDKIATKILGENYTLPYLTMMAGVFFVFLLFMAFAAVFVRGKLEVRDISIGFMSVVYLVTSFTSYSLLRYLDCGYYLFVLVLIIAWGCDISAYFVGTLIGKHKLIPEVSPKKTVEGAIGGVVIATGLSVLFGLIVTLVDKSVSANYLVLAIFGFVLSIVSQLGDLWASIIKRQYGVKDFGTVFPGHGGVLDRFDSVIAICTLMLLLSILFPPFTSVPAV